MTMNDVSTTTTAFRRRWRAGARDRLAPRAHPPKPNRLAGAVAHRITAVVLAAALPAALVFAAAPHASAANAPATAGTPSAPVNLFTENFENGVGAAPVLLSGFTGAAPQNETYTAGSAYDSDSTCDGYIVSEQASAMEPTDSGCSGNWPAALTFGEALGSWAGEDPSTNHALIEYTQGGDPGAGVVLQTNTPIALPSANRFLIIQADAAAENCQAASPLYMFNVLDGTTAEPSFSTPIAPCSNYGDVIDDVHVGTYTGDQAVLFGGTAAGIQLVDDETSGTGNDGAVDNIELLDATPQLDLPPVPGSTALGATAHLTFTLTNTTDLDAKNGWSFTANLPSGLTLADSAYTTSCGSATAAAGSAPGTVDVQGDLTQGQKSCTVTVDVTSLVAGTYSLCAAQISDPVGVNLPGCTSLTFVGPVFDAQADSAQVTSPLLNIGPLVPATYECTSSPGSDSNGVLNAGLGAVGSLGALNTSAAGTVAGNGTRTATASAQTAAVSLLGGLITADDVTTNAQAQEPLTATGPGAATTTGAATFTNLRVAGVAISANPGPNTTIGLTGVGTVTLNQQTSIAGGDGITVIALDVTLLTGTHVTVSQSTAALLTPTASCPVS
jgi:hypothetical protein